MLFSQLAMQYKLNEAFQTCSGEGAELQIFDILEGCIYNWLILHQQDWFPVYLPVTSHCLNTKRCF